MMVSRDKLFLASIIAMTLSSGAARAQVRTQYQWHSPSLRGLSTIGGDFGRYAYGLGGLSRSGQYGGGNILSSSMSAPASYQLRRSGVGTGGVSGIPGLSRSLTSGQTYESLRLGLQVRPAGLPNLSSGAEDVAGRSMMELRPYITAMEHTTALRAEGDEPITSFVPTEPSMHQRYLKQGDQFFRSAEYLRADDAFELALTIARYSPETHLCRAHSSFALGKYNAAAYHLKKALTYFSELPLARIRIRGFYGRSSGLVGHISEIRKATERPEASSNVYLVLAYFRYFDGAEAEAVEALRKAYELERKDTDKDEETTKAIQAFWEGMVVAGKASGSLDATAPATSQPAADEAPPARAAPESTTPPAQGQGKATGAGKTAVEGKQKSS